MKNIHFKNFLLNEQKEYLGHKVGDILSAVHDLLENGVNLSILQLVKNGKNIVNQIRKIIHSNWTTEELQYLKKLQKIAVAIMRGIDEKEDLKQILMDVSHELEKLSKKLGTPIHHLATSAEDEGEAPKV